MEALDNNAKDILNMLDASQWQIPDSYWHARFPKEVILEFEDLLSIDLDWQYLCLRAEDLFKTSRKDGPAKRQ
ncbi:hypothetical protein VTN77DRAFT_5836 [Rasamsonia byssochlamydoides]|uniref:uncharacterized protein n=1 Tax=Rasamsonia byssochlamydoides TaxID=89139 RepID=UPI003743F804